MDQDGGAERCEYPPYGAEADQRHAVDEGVWESVQDGAETRLLTGRGQGRHEDDTGGGY